MKNGFFEAFGEIDEKYINEAANTGYEECYAEEIKPIGVRKRIYPAVIKYAACAAVIGIAVFAVSSATGFGGISLTPNSSGVSDYETEAAYSEAVTLPQYQYEIVCTSVGENTPNSPTQEEKAARNAAREDWNSRILVSPTDSELPDYYTTKFGGWAAMVLPVPKRRSEVRAISEGEVVFSGYCEANLYHDEIEHYVVIKHNDYVYTAYSGIDTNLSLHVGDIVEAGQCVGYANLKWIDDKPAFSFYIGESNFADK